MPYEDVSDFFSPTSPSEKWGIFGWSIGTDADFRSVTSDGLDNKGSYALSVVNRGSLPNLLVNNFRLDSFQYECLQWEVGTVADLEFDENGIDHFFAQSVRKGYKDSMIK
jgi:hypothetical protein